MTIEEIENMLCEMGIPWRNDHFTQKEMRDIALPIVVYMVPEKINFFAGGKVYFTVLKLKIELYSDHRDLVLEKKLEDILNKHELTWQQDTDGWIQTENYWKCAYEMEA